MTSFYLSHQASPLEGIIEYPSHISSSTPFTQESHEASACMCPIFFNPSSTQPGGHRGDQQMHQHNHDVTQVNKLDPNFLRLSLVPATDDDTKDYNNSNYKSSMIDEDGECSARWMPSKMRFMRKMMNSNNQIEKPTRRNNKALQNQQEPLMPPNEGSNISSRSSNGDPSNSPIRVCSDCQTTKTPLWRSGPCGPKSLCNACGIRQRKARRALAAAAMGGGGLITTEASSKVKKDDMGVNCTLPFKKRCKFMDGARLPKKHKPRCFDDEFTIRLSKSSAFHQVFPQDEREAAILLMALSCGLICG